MKEYECPLCGKDVAHSGSEYDGEVIVSCNYCNDYRYEFLYGMMVYTIRDITVRISYNDSATQKEFKNSIIDQAIEYYKE